MCLDAAISTDDVGIGSPEASTGAPLADIAAGLGDLEEEVRDARRPDPDLCLRGRKRSRYLCSWALSGLVVLGFLSGLDL
jgi:hypothetical protein